MLKNLPDKSNQLQTRIKNIAIKNQINGYMNARGFTEIISKSFFN